MNLAMSELAQLFWVQFWQVTILIGFVALLGNTILRHRPHLMHLLWVVVIVKTLVLPLWGSPTGVFSWIQPRATDVGAVDGYMTPAPSPTVAVPQDSSAIVEASSANQGIFTAGYLASTSLVVWFLAIWVFGVALLLSYTVRRWLAVYRTLKRQSCSGDDALQEEVRRLARQLGLKSSVRLIVSKANYGPMVFSSIRPIVILPEALTQLKSPDELRPIIVHELLHVRRGDTTFGALQFIAQVVWWFHPMVWWACKQANRVSERCCDEESVANLQCQPKEYASCLLDALEMRATLNVAPALPGIRSADITTNRVKNILLGSGGHVFQKTTPRRYWLYAVGLAFLVFPGGKLTAQAEDDKARVADVHFESLRHQAEQAAANGRWEQAADAFRDLTQRDDQDVRAWFMLGYCLHAGGKIDEAIVVHKRAATFRRAKPVALYNLACAYALKGRSDDAIATLKQAIDAGFISVNSISEDDDFESLKEDPRFVELASAAQPNSDREVYRQFDFWIGDWDVFDGKGRKVGSNTITKDQKGFLLTEKWSNTDGGTGTSINYYDPSEQKWKQTWVDAGGNIVHYSGGLRSGKMSFDGRLTRPNGEVFACRVSYTQNKDGSVRQLIEHSNTDGRTWIIYFDGRYVPRSH